MTLVQITNYTSPNSTDRPQVNIHCIENFFTVHDFWATCACPEKTELTWKFSLYWIYFLHSEFLSNFVLALKNRVALEFFTVLNILSTFRSFEQLACACPEKQRVFWIHSTDYIFFIIQHCWATCGFPEKRSCSEIFYCIEIFSIIQDFWATCACPEKQSCPEIFRCMEHTFYNLNFWVTCACPEKQSCPGIFHWIEYTLYIREFWATCMRLPWKTELPRNFSLYGIHSLHSEFLSNLHALAQKNRVALIFFTVFEHVFFILQDFWAISACPEKQSCPEIFRCMEHTFYNLNFWVTCACLEKQRVAQEFFTVLNIRYTFGSFEQGRTQGGGFGVKNPPLSLIFYKILLPAPRRLIVFAYFLLVNLST